MLKSKFKACGNSSKVRLCKLLKYKLFYLEDASNCETDHFIEESGSMLVETLLKELTSTKKVKQSFLSIK